MLMTARCISQAQISCLEHQSLNQTPYSDDSDDLVGFSHLTYQKQDVSPHHHPLLFHLD